MTNLETAILAKSGETGERWRARAVITSGGGGGLWARVWCVVAILKTMRRVYPLFLALVIAATSPAASTNEKPMPLFNGRDFSGWEYLNGKPADITSVCRIQGDGSIAVAGKPVGYIETTTAHKNYRLHVEWRWPVDAAKNSNGGVLLHIASGPTNSTVWPVCYQAQMKLNRAGDFLPMNGATFAEKLSTPPDAKTPQLDRSGAATEKPLGEWNSYDIVCRDGSIDLSVNGVPENRISRCSAAEGKIGIQLEGMPFELRNVTLAPLP
jgi:hypothetical protein